MERKVYDVAIVGGGIAGYQAALTLKNFKRDFIWFGVKKFGEKMLLAENVSNFPAFSGTGRELSALLDAQSGREGVGITEKRIDGVYAMGREFMLTHGKETFSARAVILASGVETAGTVKGEGDFVGRGVSYCAVCDGALYKGKKIAVVLSSKEFEGEAEYLAGFASEVVAFCLYRGAAFKAENITVSSEIPVALAGGTRVEKVLTKTGEIAVDGVFFLKNSAPPAALAPGLETEKGHVKIARDASTNLKGLFAAGDVTGRPYQFVKAAGEGLVAAFSAHEYLKTLEL